jgi:hypothetical protein
VTIAASKAGIVDEEFITTQFVTGLPASIRSLVRARRDQTLDEASLTAQAACVDGTPLQSNATLLTATCTPSSDVDSFHAYTNEHSRPRHRSQQRQWTKSPARSQSRDRSRPTSRDRRFNQPRDQTPRYKSPSRQKVAFSKSRSPSPITCRFCGIKGHTVGDCRKLLRAIDQGLVVCPKDF